MRVFFALLTGEQGVTDICVESIFPTPTPTPTIPTSTPTPTLTTELITYPDPGGLNGGYTVYIYGNEWDNTIEYFGTHGTVNVIYGPGSSVGYGLTNFGAGVVKAQGYFLATTSENHTFYLSADSGSYLWLGSHALSPNMSNYDLGNVTSEQSVSANLVPGDFLPFLLVYAQPASFNSGTTGFNLRYSTPTISKTNNWGGSNAWHGAYLP